MSVAKPETIELAIKLHELAKPALPFNASTDAARVYQQEFMDWDDQLKALLDVQETGQVAEWIVRKYQKEAA